MRVRNGLGEFMSIRVEGMILWQSGVLATGRL
ncbi:unnamed protein product [Linum tenue]|uniref:Uncharacterized protein n=1 Tax=Linum tenue TaxID=586396 RepID=A0AAV0P4L0_9ROSI|nr:unnamed protein product [Linum tenue]